MQIWNLDFLYKAMLIGIDWYIRVDHRPHTQKPKRMAKVTILVCNTQCLMRLQNGITKTLFHRFGKTFSVTYLLNIIGKVLIKIYPQAFSIKQRKFSQNKPVDLSQVTALKIFSELILGRTMTSKAPLKHLWNCEKIRIREVCTEFKNFEKSPARNSCPTKFCDLSVILSQMLKSFFASTYAQKIC